jgi:aflatoxin B1 aldehyde reductase
MDTHNFVLGTMNISYPYSSNNQTNNNEYKQIIQTYIDNVGKHSILDTAYYYGNTKTEQIIGEILPTLSIQPKISTKVNPWYQNDFTNNQLGQLNTHGIMNQLNTSLQNLQQEQVEILYLHCYDYETPIQETLEVCNTLWRKEKFCSFGLSNFSLQQTKEVMNEIEKQEYMPIKYYQGMYNLISRKVEEIFPLLNEYNIEFWGYNPLAGGLLTGKYKHCMNTEDITESSRFKNNSIYQNIYWKPEIINNLQEFFECENATEYSYQWLQHHSNMKENDKIIMGVSTLDQFNQNMKYIKNKKELKPYSFNFSYSPNYWY